MGIYVVGVGDERRIDMVYRQVMVYMYKKKPRIVCVCTCVYEEE